LNQAIAKPTRVVAVNDSAARLTKMVEEKELSILEQKMEGCYKQFNKVC